MKRTTPAMTRSSSAFLSLSARKLSRFIRVQRLLSLALSLSCCVNSVSGSGQVAVSNFGGTELFLDATITIEVTKPGETIRVSATTAEEGAYHLEESRDLRHWNYLKTFFGDPAGYAYDVPVEVFAGAFYRMKIALGGGFSRIPAGTFVMGSPDSEEGRNSNEKTCNFYSGRTYIGCSISHWR